jgi:hypothetical protein
MEVSSMTWFWLNIPLDAVFFLAVVGIPMWLVRRHPETGPAIAAVQRPVLVPVPVPVRSTSVRPPGPQRLQRVGR